MNQSVPENFKTSYSSVLNRIGVLLKRNGYEFQSNAIDHLRSALEAGSPPSILVTNDIWGSYGSVTDCNLLSDSGPQSRESAAIDQREFCSLISELATKMQSDGVANPRVVSVGDTFSAWAKRGGY